MNFFFPLAGFIASKKPASRTLICPQMARQSVSSVFFYPCPLRPRRGSSPAARSTRPIITPGSGSLLVCQPLVVISSRLPGIADRLLDPPVSNYRSWAGDSCDGRPSFGGCRTKQERRQRLRGGRAHCHNTTQRSSTSVFISAC